MESESVNYLYISFLAIEFKKYINFWIEGEKEVSWENFNLNGQKVPRTENPLLDSSILSILAYQCYYVRKISKKNAFVFLKEVVSLERSINKLEKNSNNKSYKEAG